MQVYQERWELLEKENVRMKPNEPDGAAAAHATVTAGQPTPGCSHAATVTPPPARQSEVQVAADRIIVSFNVSEHLASQRSARTKPKPKTKEKSQRKVDQLLKNE